MKRIKRFTLTAICGMTLCLPLLSAGCSPPAQTSAVMPADSVFPTSLNHETDRAATDPPAGKPGVDAGGWLTIASLESCLADLQTSAADWGCVAAWRQPDPASGQSFLVVAPGQAAADELNGYFFWLLDPSAGQDGYPELILCIDRLFSDESRETAMAGGLYCEPRARSLLEISLVQLLGERYEPALFDFLLSCYRKDFQNRLSEIEPSARTWLQAFTHVEVRYEASVSSSIAFRPLSIESRMAAETSPQIVAAVIAGTDRPRHIDLPDAGRSRLFSRIGRCAGAAIEPGNF